MDTYPHARRGRPASAVSREAVLTAAADLLDERGWSGFSVDEVARRSRVSKATIYKHWTSGFAVAIEAFGSRTTEEVPTIDSGDAPRDLKDQMIRLNRFYRSPRGRIAAQLLGAGIHAQNGADLVRDQFFGVRRHATEALIIEAVKRGQLRPDVTAALMIDLIFGPIIFRLVNGLPPLKDEEAGILAELALSALRTGLHPRSRRDTRDQ